MRKLMAMLLLAGCGGGLERVSFATDFLEYQPGGRVMLSLGNVSATDVKVNLCLARLVDERGVSVGVSNAETCESLEGEIIPPGEQRSVRKTMPTSVTGKLRYEATIVLPNGRGETVLSPVFSVQ